MADVPFIIRDLLGLNRRDGGERSSDREFYKAQNFIQLEKGQYTVRYGSSEDLVAADIPGCDRITQLHRFPNVPGRKTILYHCTPTSTAITHPGSTGLTLADVTSANGSIFSVINPPSRQVRFCYSYIGMGVESSWDTRARPGYVAWTAAGIDAWNQAGLQTITLAASTNEIDVSHPTAFPSDVRAVNVFMSLGSAAGGDAGQRSQLVYVGTIHSTAETLRVSNGIAGTAADADVFDPAAFEVEARDEGGSLQPGQYYVALAWVTDGEQQHDALMPAARVTLSEPKVIQVTSGNNSIGINYFLAAGASTNGANHCYVFFGAKGRSDAPMTHVGSFKITTTAQSTGNVDHFLITSVPHNKNAASASTQFNHTPRMYGTVLGIRHGFMVRRDEDHAVPIAEVFPSRSDWFANKITAVSGEITADFGYILIRTNQDRLFNNTAAPALAQLVVPTMVNFFGASYFANGRDFLVTNGVNIGRVVHKTDCVIPYNPNFIARFNDQLICTTVNSRGPLFASNANQANNWSDGGTGSAYKFAIVGDPFQAIPTAVSVFSYTSGIDGPSAFCLIANKNSLWSLPNVPDAAAGINAQATQLSGAVGCLAPRTMVQTKIGLLFLGSDGEPYIVRGQGEPFPVGGKVKDLLKHLAENDTLMRMCSAVWHKNYWKLVYPSSVTSTFCDAQLWADLRTDDGSNIVWNGPHIGLDIGCQLVLDQEGDDHSRIAGLAGSAASAILDDEAAPDDLGTPIVPVLEWNRRKFKAELNFKRYIGMFLDVAYNSGDDHSLLFEFFSDREYRQINKVVCVGDPLIADDIFETISALIDENNLTGRDFKFRITHTGARNFTIAAAAIPYKPEKRVII